MGTGISTVNSLGLAGMQTAQTGMANVATNVSGAAVEGFRRREIHPFMANASTDPLVQGGTVIVDSIVRSYSALVSSQYMSNHAKVRQAANLNNAAQVVDKMLVDESKGLTDVFNSFFTSASDLSADPASGTARTAFATTAVELTDRIRNLGATIDETKRQALVQMNGVVDAINDKSQALARVNQLIRASGAFGKPLPSADLLDERDRLIIQVTDLCGASIETSDYGEAILRFEGISLVQGNQAARLTVDVNNDGLPTGQIKVSLPLGEGEANRSQGQPPVVATLVGGTVVGGEFGGLMRYAQGAEQWLQRLDSLSLSLVKFGDPTIKNPPETWYSKQMVDGKLAELGFRDTSTDPAHFYQGMFRVNKDGWEERPDGSITTPIDSLRPSLTINSNMRIGADVPWSKSDDPMSSAEQGFVIGIAAGRSARLREWSDWVTSVSSDLSKWRAEEASFSAVDQSLSQQQQQISGVDLDQEATDLLKFQQIYQANSSVIQAAMRMFDALLTVTSR